MLYFFLGFDVWSTENTSTRFYREHGFIHRRLAAWLFIQLRKHHNIFNSNPICGTVNIIRSFIISKYFYTQISWRYTRKLWLFTTTSVVSYHGRYILHWIAFRKFGNKNNGENIDIRRCGPIQGSQMPLAQPKANWKMFSRPTRRKLLPTNVLQRRGSCSIIRIYYFGLYWT